MKQFLLLAIFTLSGAAYGSIYVRQHAADIVAGKKIEADDLNDEFNAIATAVNSIDGSNVVNGSLGVNAFAATSSAISLNKKAGCTFITLTDGSGTKTVQVRPPCEIFMDGVRGYITATQSISLLSNLTDGSLAFANYYFIYATQNSSAGLGFTFSQVAPTLATARKSTDSSHRYIGTIRTCDATTDIAFVSRMAANAFQWSGSCGAPNPFPEVGLIATANAVTSSISNFTVPNTFQFVNVRYASYVSGFPAQCQFSFSSEATFPSFQSVVVATAGNTGLIPGYVATGPGLLVENISNCVTGGDIRVRGWIEPIALHQ